MSANRSKGRERKRCLRRAVTPGATFERVMAGLRGRLRAGTFALGDALEPAHLADDLFTSITPVRDALHRLVGERLVEVAPSGGFRVPLLTEVGLRHLYDWNQRLLLLAIADAVRPSEPLVIERAAIGVDADDISGVFGRIAQLSRNPECIAALTTIDERLAMVRVREQALLGIDDAGQEASALQAQFDAGQWIELRRAIQLYHRRRDKLVGRIVAALHQPSAPPA